VCSFPIKIILRPFLYQMWVEKYRPKTFNDVSLPEKMKAAITRIAGKSMPNMLLYGPAGTGKTSTAHAIVHDLKCKKIEVNASMHRGIDMIRKIVVPFAQSKAGVMKVVILDEADAMTHEAQSALRRVMEDNQATTRFFIICNYLAKIIDPIVSRCSRYHFSPLVPDVMRARLGEIIEKENVQIDVDTVNILMKIGRGDMRRTIMLLQTCFTSGKGVITSELIYDESGQIPKDLVETLIGVETYDDMEEAVNVCLNRGYTGSQAIHGMLEAYKGSNRSDVVIAMAEADFRLGQGADEYLQLLAVLCVIKNSNGD